MYRPGASRQRSPERSSVGFGGVREHTYELSEKEQRAKAAAAAAPLAAAEQVRVANQELGAELSSLRQDSGALAGLSAVRQLLSGSPPAAAGQRYGRSGNMDGSDEEMQRPGRDSMDMDVGMSQAQEELRLAESILHGTAPPPGGQFGSPPPPQRPSTWSNVPVELSAEEQEEIRHKIYGSLLSAADSPPQPTHQHPMDAEQSALGEERAEASRLRAALLRFDQDGDANSSLANSMLSDADAAAAQPHLANTMASHLERIAYESERSRLQDAEQLAADEQELQRLKAEIARNKHFGDEERQQDAHATEFLQSQLNRCAVVCVDALPMPFASF